MRWLVLILVVANLAVFAWFSMNDPKNVRSVDEGRLPRVAEIELIDQQGYTPPVTDKPVDVSDPVIEAPTLPEPVQADSENEGAGDVSEPAMTSAAEESVVGLSGRRECYGVGWFEESEAAESYRQGLSRRRPELDVLRVAERREPLEPFHWVMIPPMESRQAALVRYRQLTEQGVEAYVVPSGERENAISLGLFRSLRSAERVLEQRQQQNINAILVKFPRNRISYALVFEGAPPESLEAFAGASGQSEAGLQLIEFSDCEGVATAEKNP